MTYSVEFYAMLRYCNEKVLNLYDECGFSNGDTLRGVKVPKPKRWESLFLLTIVRFLFKKI